eukprot:TRINITY_DN7481_c0_g1_i3.p1 TRINITY_DN7481_c0_g1~~TRINITY_DN7481_c0_g1_i3.p1  ORF type:complete len:916 (-),score=214.06 TRINITY_DN7481_c0_g1_i3:27-2612(-)
MIAFAAVDGICNQTNAKTKQNEASTLQPSKSEVKDDASTNSQVGGLSHPFFVLHADVPEEFVTILTQHTSSIKFMDWAPSSYGSSILLTADEHERICFWSMERRTNKFVCFSSFDLESVVEARWLIPPPNFGPRESVPLTVSSLEEKFHTPTPGLKIPQGMLAMIAVNASATIYVWFYKSFADEVRNVISCKLRFPKKNVGRVDILTTNEGRIMMFVSPSQGNTIYVYDVQVDLINTQISSELMSKIEIPISQLNLNSEFVILNTVASKNGTVLHVVVADMTHNGKCKLQRWEFKEDDIVLDECFSGFEMREKSWVMTSEVPMGTEDDWSNFVTSLRVLPYGNAITVSHIDGSWTLLNPDTLQIIQKQEDPDSEEVDEELNTKRKAPASNGSAKSRKISDTQSPQLNGHSENSEENSNHKKTIVSQCLSSNGTCFALLGMESELTLCHLGNYRVVTAPYEKQGERNVEAKALMDMMEVSYLNNCDSWDIVVYILYRTSTDQELLEWVIQYGMRDAKMNSPFLMTMNRLSSLLWRNVKGNQHNFIDSQMRLLMMFHLENLRSSMEPLHYHHLTFALTNMLDERSFYTALDDVNLYRSQSLPHLIVILEWIADLIPFLLTNFLQFANSDWEFDNTLPTGITSELPMNIYYPIYSARAGKEIPGISFFFDMDALSALQELMYHCLAVIHRGPKLDSSISVRDNVTSVIKNFHDIFVSMKQELTELFAKITPTAGNASKVLTEISQIVKTKVHSSPSTSIPQLFHTLDLYPSVMGVLDSNKVPQRNFQYDYILKRNLKRSVCPLDSINRKILTKEGFFRQCLRCHRVTSQGLTESVSYNLWMSKWDMACGVCGGIWWRSHWDLEN